jgi:probable DNA repair protein
MTLSNEQTPKLVFDCPSQVLDYKNLFQRLQAGHQLVTANSRLTRVLTDQYNQWRINQGDQQWPSPNILAWNLWMDGLWETASLHGIDGTDKAVPNTRQLSNLWESTLSGTTVKHNLLHPESLASQLRDTRKLVREWHVSLDDPAWRGFENENHAAFYKWNQAFEALCEASGWIAPEDRASIIAKAIEQSNLKISGPIDLLGFDEFNPQQINLLSALHSQNVELNTLSINPCNSSPKLWKSPDSKTELKTMARWVRHQFESNATDNIAVVVPDLQSRRQEIERHLQDVLMPGIYNASSKPWNISMGLPLSRVPMVETAFDLLKLLDDRFEITDVGRALGSPWLRGARQERNSRALLEKCLREKHPRQLKLGDVRYRSKEIKDKDRNGNDLPEVEHTPQIWNCPELSKLLDRLANFANENKGTRLASSWAESFDQLLAALGWPLSADTKSEGSHTQSGNWHNNDWQTLQSWRDALRELASLDATQKALSRNAAIGQLKQICREKIFQAKTDAAPIQVLGLYEVNGLRFDHLWVVGLHNDNWPTSAKPNPFIPGRLQRAVGLPNSSPQRELEVARVITQRLLRTANNTIFSYPGKVDGENVSPSPLLSTSTPIKDTELPVWQGKSWLGTVAAAEPPVIDALIMPDTMSHGTARGGSSILKNQALCPFRAFASNRLGAEELETPADGISASLHGSLLHSVLEYFWKETLTQQALLALSQDELASRVQKHVDAVVADEYGLNQRPAFRVVEADRIFRLVMDYIELDKTREPFEVTGFEREVLADIQGQTIRLIVDRIDRLPSGDEVIIDYKTGQVDPKKWFGERPEDPQMPLYAITATGTPSGLAFAVIRDDGCVYKGVATTAGLLPGLPVRDGVHTRDLAAAGEDMPLAIANWRAVIHRLMSEFLAGNATIDPKFGLNTCEATYCKLQSLCRVGEMLQRKQSGQPESGGVNL